MRTQFILGFLVFLSVHAGAQTLTLGQAVEEAKAQSPEVAKLKSVYTEAGWKRVESYSGFLPTLNLTTTYYTNHKYLLTDVDFGGGPMSVPGVVPTSNFILTTQIPLFDGFASTNRYLSARSFEEAARADYEWAGFQIERKVTLQFIKALGAKTLQKVSAQNLKALEDHLVDVSRFKRAGMSTNYDVLRVEVQVNEAKSAVLNSADDLDLSKDKLAEILGHDAEPRELQGELPVLSPDLIKAISVRNVTERADLRALRSRTKGYDDLEDSASRFWVPRINFVGQYQYYNNRNETFDDFDNYREAYQIGFSLVWNLFDGMSSIAKSKQSVEQHYQYEKSLQIAQVKAKQDLDLWKRKFIYFCSIFEFRKSDVAKATEAVRLAREGRRVGSRTNTDLLDTESELFRAQAGLVNAQVGAAEALINLELALGQKLTDFKL